MTAEVAKTPKKKRRVWGKKTTNCIICGVKFTTHYQKKIVCDKPDCKVALRKLHGKHYVERRRNARPPKPIYTCPICGNLFEARSYKQITCGNPKCAHKRHMETITAYRHAIKNGLRPAPASHRERKENPKDDDWFPELPKIIRKCLKCDKEFETDVNWICDPCHERNAEIYMP